MSKRSSWLLLGAFSGAVVFGGLVTWRAGSGGEGGTAGQSADARSRDPHAPRESGHVLERANRVGTRTERSEPRSGRATLSREGLRVEASGDGLRIEARDPADPAKPSTTLSLATEMRRGTNRVGEGVRSVRRGRDGSIELDRGEVLERVAPAGDGVEQTWTFARAPEGTGPLEVRIAESDAFVRSDAEGLHFHDEGASHGLRYGQATFVDARGARTRVAVYYEAGALRARIPGEVIDRAAYPAVLDPFIGPEVPVTMGEPPALSPRTQHDPRIACSATNCMLVWSDEIGEDLSGFGPDLYGIRVAFDGTILDSLAIPIDAGRGFERQASIASNGSEYFVAWMLEDPDLGKQELRGRMIDAATGALATPDPIILDPNGQSPTVLVNGTTFEVVYGRSSTVFVSRIAANGASIDLGPDEVFMGDFFAVQAANAGPTAAVFLCAGGWTSFDVSSRRIDLDTHTALDADVEPIATAVASLATTASPNWFGVAMSVPNLASASDIVFSRVGVADGALHATSNTLSVTGGGLWKPPAVAFSASFVVSWSEQDDRVDMARVDEDGTVLTGTPVTRIPAEPGVALGNAAVDPNGRPVLAYREPGSAGGTAHVAYAAYSSPSGAASPRVLVGRMSSWHDGIGAATTDLGQTLVVFTVSHPDGSKIRAAFADLLAVPDSLAPAFDVVTDTRSVWGPAVVSDGSRFLVVWTRNVDPSSGTYAVRAAFIEPDATVSPAFDVSTTVLRSSSTPKVVYDATSQQYLVVWPGYDGSTTDVYARRISKAGTLVGTEIVVGGTSSESDAVVGALSGKFFVAWTDTRDFPTTGVDVYGTILSDTGVPTDPTGVPYVNGAAHESPVTVATTATSFVLLSRDGSGSIIRHDIDASGAVVGGNGNVALSPPGGGFIDLVEVSTANGRALVAAIVWNANTRSLYVGDLASGALPDAVPGGVRLSPFALTPTGPDDYLLAYTRMVSSETELGSRGRVVRIGIERALGDACTSAIECASGTCEDGVCCNGPCGGSTTDCRACSVAAGAPADGTCANIVQDAAYVCRAAASGCDIPETCDGLAATCPADETTCGTGGGTGGGTGSDGGLGGGTGGGMGGGGGGGGDVGSVGRPSASLCSVGVGAGAGSAFPLSMLLVCGAIAWRRARARRAALLMAALVLSFAASPPTVAHAQAAGDARDPETVARLHFQLGQALYQEGRFADAAREFQAAYDASHRPQLLYNVYVANRDAQQLEAALVALRAFVETAPESETANLRSRLASLEAQVEEMRRLREERDRAAAAQNAAREAEPAAEEEPEIADATAVDASASAEVEEDGGSAGRRIAGYSLIGVGAAGLTTFTIAALRIGTKDDGLAPYCGAAAGLPDDRCLDVPEVADARSSITTLRAIGWSSLGLGVAAAAVGTVLVLTGGESDDTEVSFACDPNGCYGTVSGRF